MTAGVKGVVKTIGLMSGTSLDGVDAALLETDGATIVRPGPALMFPYRPEMRALLRAALDEAISVEPGEPTPKIAEAEHHLTIAHIQAVKALLAQERLSPAAVTLIGFHGQTILHRPAERL